MKHVDAEFYAKTENFKSISMPASTQSQHPERAGVSLRDKKYSEAILLCSILEKSFQQIANKEGHELNSIAAQLVLT
jgi:hypothetical protein